MLMVSMILILILMVMVVMVVMTMNNNNNNNIIATITTFTFSISEYCNLHAGPFHPASWNKPQISRHSVEFLYLQLVKAGA